jgi:hypothetical protein
VAGVLSRQTGLSVRVGEPPAGVVDDDAVVAGSQARCPSLVGVAWLGGAVTAVSWADRRGLRERGSAQLRCARRPTQGPLARSRHRHGAAGRWSAQGHAHTVVAVDQAGRQLGQATVAARTLGRAELPGWARRRWPDERVWAVEDCRRVTGRLERDLLAAGERVVRVPPRLLGGARQAVRALGKSDPIDASRSPGRRCANPTCRPLATTRRPWRSSCWSTTAST